MSLVLTTEHDVIDYAVSLDGGVWRALSNQMAWLHRRQAPPEDMPKMFEAVAEIVSDPASWQKIKREVSSQRRANYRLAHKAKLESAILRRRSYMREYMARRRARK